MARLIDADKLYPDCLTKQGKLAISQSQIANAPTVEPCANCEDRLQAEYIRHSSSWNELQALRKFKAENERPTGEWKETRYETAIGVTYRQTQCSNCGWEDALSMWWNFCPNCGAEMGKETENDKG